MKILFLIPYPQQEAPSQRFRFEQYFQLLAKDGHYFEVQSFLSGKDWKVFYSKGRALQKCFILITGFIKRIGILFILRKFDFIFIHREVTPIGPPIFERIIARIFQKKIIYDFDDSIWLTDKTNEPRLEKLLRWRYKVGLICKWSYKISCGNSYLCAYAREFNKNVVLNPTTIDVENLHNREITPSDRKDTNIVIGWTGSHSTLKYLKLLEPVLFQLETIYANVRVLIIADQNPNLNLNRVDFIPWNKGSEAIDLQRIDLGIMPLPDDDWAKGKCGFKALQYMAMEIPCVVSAVGVNTSIVDHGVSGYCVSSDSEWLEYLSKLINDPVTRKMMGEAGKKRVVDHYSVNSNAENFNNLFN